MLYTLYISIFIIFVVAKVFVRGTLPQKYSSIGVRRGKFVSPGKLLLLLGRKHKFDVLFSRTQIKDSLGNYNFGTNKISIPITSISSPSIFHFHTVTHEFGHQLVYKENVLSPVIPFLLKAGHRILHEMRQNYLFTIFLILEVITRNSVVVHVFTLTAIVVTGLRVLDEILAHILSYVTLNKIFVLSTKNKLEIVLMSIQGTCFSFFKCKSILLRSAILLVVLEIALYFFPNPFHF